MVLPAFEPAESADFDMEPDQVRCWRLLAMTQLPANGDEQHKCCCLPPAVLQRCLHEGRSDPAM